MSSKTSPSEKKSQSNQPSSNRLENYNTVAETIGGMPSLRVKDNLIQSLVIAVTTFVSVIIGTIMGGAMGAFIAIFLGLVLSTFVSGFVLMILGWVRAAKKIMK
jgi:VIT1/CCC1 family predicted Fe2+/Mn2+ transporter